MYYDEDAKWNSFEISGKISDYLEYKGINCRSTEAKGECKVADTDNRGCSYT